MGMDGLVYMLENAVESPCDLYFEIPSCVPAVPFETSGAVLTAADTEYLFDKYPQLIGLGEMMNVPGVLSGDSEVLKKIDAAKKRGKLIEGHYPMGGGDSLKKYVAAGITSDHESISAEEALEKVSAGMMVYIREGSSAANLADLISAVTPGNCDRFCFCADDISANDLLTDGDILRCVRKAVRLGMSPEIAVKIACENPRRHFGLPESSGDYIIVDNLQDFNILKVFKNGKQYC